MFRRVVNVIEYVAVALAATFFVLLFVYQPSTPSPSATATASAGGGSGSEQQQGASGQSVYINNCATCHGSKGEGGIGPKIGGGAVASRFPNASDEILIVSSGRDGMPAWSGRLTADEIKAVVEYTRSGL